VGEAKGAEAVVFLAGEAEADHVAAGFKGHRVREKGRGWL
jgi:hypothetical protein